MSNNSAALNAAELSAELASRIEDLAATLLPSAMKASGTLAVGSVRGERGQALRIFLRGNSRGRWKDFADGDGGDALDLVAQCLFQGDRKRAYAWGCTGSAMHGRSRCQVSGLGPKRRVHTVMTIAA